MACSSAGALSASVSPPCTVSETLLVGACRPASADGMLAMSQPRLRMSSANASSSWTASVSGASASASSSARTARVSRSAISPLRSWRRVEQPGVGVGQLEDRPGRAARREEVVEQAVGLLAGQRWRDHRQQDVVLVALADPDERVGGGLRRGPGEAVEERVVARRTELLVEGKAGRAPRRLELGLAGEPLLEPV